MHLAIEVSVDKLIRKTHFIATNNTKNECFFIFLKNYASPKKILSKLVL